MSKIMLVNVTHVEESRVAILEDGVLEQYEIETLNRANIKGNMHNAVVDNVHPSLEAAFLRLSSDLKGFLPLDEVNFKLLPSRGDGRARGRIGQHLHPGQKLMVQVVREPFAGKPPTVTTYFSLPGRFLVLMPGVDSSGVSRKIEDTTQRERLKHLIEELHPPEGFGVIVRTAGLGQSKQELQRDLRYLLRLWESIQRASRATEFPGLVYRERDLVIRTMRDYFTPEINEVWIDSPEIHQQALEFIHDVMPGKAKIVKLYTGEQPLFGKFNLEEQIESIYQRRVSLKSGGEIVIDGTEALTAIDVNSARASRQGDAEENALQTNTEAAAEIGRQLRLRDLGGLVVVDFIDMMAARNNKKVEKAMRDALKADRAKHDVTRISKLGLMEIARQRVRAEKLAASYTTCPACDGFGLIKNVEAAALAALRKLQTRCMRGGFGRMRVALPTDVAAWILNNKRDDLSQLERRYAIRITVDAKASLLRHESEFEALPREKAEAPPALVAGDRPAPPIPPDLKEIAAAEPLPSSPAASPSGPTEEGQESPAAGMGRRKRRRRRRHGRAQMETTDQPAFASESSSGEFAAVAEDSANHAHEALPTAPANAPSENSEPSPAVPGGPSSGGEASTEHERPFRRRRRRRRRRDRGATPLPGNLNHDRSNLDAPAGWQGRPDAGQREHESLQVSEDDGAVPRHIRSEELMPAATGGAGRAASKTGTRARAPRRRRSRGGGSHTPRSGGEEGSR